MKSQDMALAKKGLPEGGIDLSLGEPVLIRENLHNLFKKLKYTPSQEPLKILECEYPHAAGRAELVEFLKFKHKVKHVVITNGAKQGISAAFRATKSKTKKSVWTPSPHWLSFPTLAKSEGLKLTNEQSEGKIWLLTFPNNPDGNVYSNPFDRAILSMKAIKDGIPVIHDAAYNSEQYLKPGEELQMGNIGVYSYAKTYGLAGLRIGYAITDNEEYYDAMCEYIEETTMGVSTASQEIILQIEKFFYNNPGAKQYFMDNCRRDLNRNRAKLLQIDPRALKVKSVPEYGMFAFVEKGPKIKQALKKSKVFMLDGKYFGQPKYMRVSLGQNSNKFAEAIDRINANVV